MNTQDKLTKAVIGLLLDSPFFGLLARRLKRIPDPGIPTAATNGRVLRYNPKFIDSLSLDNLKGILAHEILHCALDHHRRRGQRDMARWNTACDFAVNDVLKPVTTFGLPPTALYNPAFHGQSAENIYSQLPDSPPQGGGSQQGQGSPTAGGGQSGVSKPQPGGSKPPAGPQDAQNGRSEDVPDPGGCGAVFDAEDDSQAARAEERVSLAQAYTQAKSRGALPGCIENLVEPILHPKLDVRTLLADFVDRSAKSDYSWRKPNSRYAHLGVILPTLYSERLKLVVGIDTSGSISDDDLQRFGSILREVLSSYPQVELDAVYCDARIQRVDHHETCDPEFQNPNVGRGGTKFEPVFDWVTEQGEDPACLIYLTDLQGSFPNHEPPYPVLWLSTDDRPVPFGQVVQLPKEV